MVVTLPGGERCVSNMVFEFTPVAVKLNLEKTWLKRGSLSSIDGFKAHTAGI